MFHCRTQNNKINKLHERVLRLVYKNDNLTFQELPKLDNSVTIHYRNLQILSTGMYKAKNHISPLPMQELFTKQDIPYNLRNKRCWEVPRTRTVCDGTETIKSTNMELVPVDIKEADHKVHKHGVSTCRYKRS